MLAQAMKYWEVGLSPIPLVHGTKIPPKDTEWKPYVDIRPSYPQMKEWFDNDEKQNLGLVIRGKFIVVDFDNLGSFKVWEIKNPLLSQTYTVKSSRGFHLYFQADERPELTYHFCTGEVKASGYVVAPPSLHPSGKNYNELLDVPILSIDSYTELNLAKVITTNGFKYHPRRYYGESTTQKIKNALSIEVFLSRITNLYPAKDNKLMAKCPFHNDNNPSMIVDHMAYCFSPGCTAHRQLDVIALYALYNKIAEKEAIARLAKELLD